MAVYTRYSAHFAKQQMQADVSRATIKGECYLAISSAFLPTTQLSLILGHDQLRELHSVIGAYLASLEGQSEQDEVPA